MLSRTIAVSAIAIAATVLGFGGTAKTAVDVAKILFLISMVLLLIASWIGRNRPTA